MSRSNHCHPNTFQAANPTLSRENDIEKRLQALAAKDGIRVKEFFIDFDKLRKGTVGEAAFRTCLGTLNISLSEADIQDLIGRYRVSDGTGMINYSQFLDKLNVVFSDQMDPSATISGVKAQAVWSDSDRDAMMECVTNLNNKIKAERILLKPAFEDFDRSRQLHITQHQFLRVLKQLGLMPSSQETFDLLIRKYCDRGTTAEVNYWKFCQDLDKPEDIFPGYTPKHAPQNRTYFPGVNSDIRSPFFANATNDVDVINNRWLQPRVEIFNDPTDIEERLRHTVVMKRVRIEQFF